MVGVDRGWDAAQVRTWLQSRIAAARGDQVAAERHGRGQEDDCDKAAAEEMVCSALASEAMTASQAAFTTGLADLLDRDHYLWRGVYNDDRFDRHVRSYAKKLAKMTKANVGFENLKRYQ